MRSVAGGGVRVVEMPGRQGDGGQRRLGWQRVELRRNEDAVVPEGTTRG